jgi:hypothetical protein
MLIEELVIEKLRELPPEKQREVLDFVEFLQYKTAPKRPRRSLKGLWADLDIEITEEDIREARREILGLFADEPMLIDEITHDIMKSREQTP